MFELKLEIYSLNRKLQSSKVKIKNATQKCEEKIINLKDLFEVTEEEVLDPDFCGVPSILLHEHSQLIQTNREKFRKVIELETQIFKIKQKYKIN